MIVFGADNVDHLSAGERGGRIAVASGASPFGRRRHQCPVLEIGRGMGKADTRLFAG
jgi:hypothetical protein